MWALKSPRKARNTLTDHDYDRVIFGVLSLAIGAQRREVAKRRTELGKRDKSTLRSVARLDELREAHCRVNARHSELRHARRVLGWVLYDIEQEGAPSTLTLDCARRLLAGESVEEAPRE